MLDVLYLAVGLAVLAVALFACIALHRLARALGALEDALTTTEVAIQAVTPELRDGLESVNDIAAGVNVALRTAGGGANRLTHAAARSLVPAQSTLHGVKVGATSLFRSLMQPNESKGGDQTYGTGQ